MEYWSRLGSICYYDFQHDEPFLCEPTMLFILGLEAVITPSNEYSFDDIVLNNTLISQDILDKIYKYLNNTDKSLNSSEIKFYCGNLKKILSEISGSSQDRIVPIIYHDGFDKEPISDFNKEADELIKIFEYAGYDTRDVSVKYLAGADNYNNLLKEEHETKKLYSKVYKKLDYKAMYSYALGVLYGCTLLGYSFDFKSYDNSWYDGEYSNLIRTALHTFNFHLKYIKGVDNDLHLHKKYKCIQINKIWNYTNTR
jgi:hypothetical protein